MKVFEQLPYETFNVYIMRVIWNILNAISILMKHDCYNYVRETNPKVHIEITFSKILVYSINSHLNM